MLYPNFPNFIQRALLAAFVLCLFALPAAAQSTRGIEFWTGFMYNVSTNGVPGDLSIYVTARTNVTGVISIPQIGWSTNFGVPANTGRVINLPSALIMSYGSEGVENKGVRIVTTDTVDIFGLNYSPQTVDASLIFSVDALGTDYRVAAYNGTITDGVPMPSQFLVVATENGTRVEITPSSTTLAARPPNVPFTITLDAGQVYQVQSQTDLTGSMVRSVNGKKIAVYAGSARAFIPQGNLFSDHIYEQLYPIDRWGKSFITVPLKTRRGDTYRVVAAYDNTNVTIDDANPFTLNAGEFREMMLSTPSVIESDQPILVAQYSNSSQFDFVQLADPFMVVLSPTDYMRRELRFQAFTLPTIEKSYVNVVTLTNAISSVRLDGVSIASQFQPVPNDPFFSWAQVEVSKGEHSLSAFWGLIAYVYGYGELESYGYATGAEKLLPCPYPSITALGDTVFCEGGSVVLDAGPGYDGYQWSNNATSRSITVTSSGSYSVITLDSNGCQRPSREIDVTVNALPQPAIALAPAATICPCDSATLTAPPGFRYRWTTGDTTQSIVVRQAGSYGVDVTNDFGCTGTAAPVSIAIDDRTSEVAIGQGSAGPGEMVRIPLYITNPGNVAACGIGDYTVAVRFDRSVLIFTGVDGATVVRDSTDGVHRIVTMSGGRSGDTLATLTFKAALGQADSSMLDLVSFQWDDCASVRAAATAGRFQLTDICRVGGPRLIAITDGTALKPGRPNPAGEMATIEYTLGEQGKVDLYITDLLGNRVATLASGEAAPGSYEASLDATMLPTGTYFCVLETNTERLTGVLRVAR